MIQYWKKVIIIKIQIFLNIGKDTRMEILKLRTKLPDTLISQAKCTLRETHKDFQIIFIWLVFNSQDVIKQQLKNGDSEDQKMHIPWEYFIGKWMIFGKDLPGPQWNTVADGNLFNIQYEEFLLLLP